MCAESYDLAVIIPCLNEGDHLLQTLHSLHWHDHCKVQVIVVDGGSSDQTLSIARTEPYVQVVQAEKGRGRQIWKGLQSVSAAWTLVLHADCRLPNTWQNDLRKVLEDSAVCGGAFRFAVDDARWKFRLLEAMVYLRSHFFKWPFGDQAIFLKTSLALQMSDLESMLLMEDVRMAQALRKMGKMAMLSSAVCSSARRWQKRGILANALRNASCLWAYFRRQSNSRIYHDYYVKA